MRLRFATNKADALGGGRAGFRRVLASFLSGLMLSSVACQQFPDPFKDELAGRPPVSTPSADGVRSSTPEREAVRHRDLPGVTMGTKVGAVTHGPLYFEDPHETARDPAGAFAWTLGDYWNILYGPSRLLVDIGFFPVSATVAPPWIMSKTGPERCYGSGAEKRHIADHDLSGGFDPVPEGHLARSHSSASSLIRHERRAALLGTAVERVPRSD